MKRSLSFFRCHLVLSAGLFLGVVGYPSLAVCQNSQFTVEPLISNTLGFGVSGGYYICHNAHVGAGQLQFVSRIRLGSIVGLEGGIGYNGEQRFSYISETGEDFAASVHSIPLTGSLILFIPLAPNLTPYLTGGLGAHYMILDYSKDLNNTIADKKKTRFGYHLGFGLEIPLNNHVALLGEYKYLYVDNAFEEGDVVEVDFSSTHYKANLFSGGVVVYF